MLRFYLRGKPWRLIATPIAAFLWPLVAYNYHLRARGKAPDQWYWADALLFYMGFTVE